MSTNDPFGAPGATPPSGASTPPSGQWTQGPGPQVPPTGTWQPTPGHPRGFFNSLRYSGWYRGDNRVIGGVCSGIAARTGWDLTLVRGLTVVLAIFVGPVLVAYGLYWAFLPEQRDGRIHAESLFQGHFDAAQLGALVLVLMGLGNSSVLNLTWNDSRGVIWSLTGIAVVVAIVIAVIAAATSGGRRTDAPPPQGVPPVRPTPEQPAPPFPGAPFASMQPTSWTASPVPPAGGAQPGPAQSFGAPWGPGVPTQGFSPELGVDAPGAVPPSSGGFPPAYPAPAPAWTAPTQRFLPRRVSTAQTLSITGLVVLVIAGALFAMHWLQRVEASNGDVIMIQIMLVSGGACLLVVGIALAVAANRDRGAGGLIALSIVGVLLAIPASIVAVGATRDYSSAQVGTSSYGTDSYDWTTDDATSTTGTGVVILDLTGAPQGTTKTIHVDGQMGEVRVLLRQDQPVSFTIGGGVGAVNPSYWTDDAGNQPSSNWVPSVGAIYDSLDFRNDAWTKNHGITVDIGSIVGSVSIQEQAPGTVSATPTPSASSDAAQSGGAQSGASTVSPSPSPATSSAKH